MRAAVTPDGRGRPAGRAIRVRAVDAAGRPLGQWLLGHGQRPAEALWHNGFVAGEVVSVEGRADAGDVEISVRARQRLRADAGPAVRRPLLDPGLGPRDAAGAVRVQRLAAYALVHGLRGVLLTQLSARTHAAGDWGLPGGGVEPGESLAAAAVREVAEETGQDIRLLGVHSVSDAHWIGRAPNGEVEDFHAVRLVWRAVCDQPTDPVVHDVGGTTAAAAWVPSHLVPALPLSTAWRTLLLAEVGGPPAQTGRPGSTQA